MQKKYAPKGAHKGQPNNNSIHAQRQRLLNGLIEAGEAGLTTIQLREQYDIMAPAPRVYELRHQQGHNIATAWNYEANAQGNRHRNARYILMPGKYKGVAA